MDNIQKELIKAGRKDLAQEYYRKVAAYDSENFELASTLHNLTPVNYLMSGQEKTRKALDDLKINQKSYYDNLKQKIAQWTREYKNVMKTLNVIKDDAEKTIDMLHTHSIVDDEN